MIYQKILETMPNHILEMKKLEDEFSLIGQDMMGRSGFVDRRFRSFFGTTPGICAHLWEMLTPEVTLPNGARKCHLLWALLFLKQYNTDHVNSSIVGTAVDEKTFRKWCWLFIEQISYLSTELVE